ncbi:MAG: LamG domain-containing protein [Candidatus Paceibacterota bacterium]
MKRYIITIIAISFLAPSATFATIGVPTDYLAINSGLVGWWTMDGKNTNWGTNTTGDISGNGNTGTLVNMSTSTSPTQGEIGQALIFDGVNDYVDAGSASSVDDIETTGSGMTISMWIYPRGYGSSNAGVIVGKGANFVSGYFQFVFDGYGPTLAFQKDYDGASNLDARIPFAATRLNKWQHLTVTWDGSATAANIHFYINGAEITKSYTANGVGNKLSDASYSLGIGSRIAGNYTNGTLDDVRIYNRALSGAEVAKLYTATAGNKIATSQIGPANLNSGLVGWWTFDGSKLINNASDSSGLGNNGNLVNFGATSSAVTAGKIGQGLKFDGIGSNQYVTMGNSSILNTPSAVTLSAWVKSGFNFNSVSSLMFAVISRMQSSNPFPGYELGIGGNYLSAGNKAYFNAGGTFNPNVILGTTAVNDGKWHHLVGKYDGTKSYIYVDGILQNSADKTNNMNLATEFLDIGVGYDRGANSYFNGSIDDVRVYNRALSATEVAQLYNIGR